MKEREQDLEEPEDQENFWEIVSSGNDREATPMKFQQQDLVSDSTSWYARLHKGNLEEPQVEMKSWSN